MQNINHGLRRPFNAPIIDFLRCNTQGLKNEVMQLKQWRNHAKAMPISANKQAKKGKPSQGQRLKYGAKIPCLNHRKSASRRQAKAQKSQANA